MTCDGQVLKLVLGAHSFRYFSGSATDKLREEPSVAWRDLDTGRVLRQGEAFGLEAEQMFVCWTSRNLAKVRFLDSDLSVDGRLITGFLRYLRRRWSDVDRRFGRRGLLVTGAPEILKTMETSGSDAARDAGFPSIDFVPEHRCLVRTWQTCRPSDLSSGSGCNVAFETVSSLGAPGTTCLLLDVGHGGSRLYPYLDGRHRPDLGAVVSHGGAEMLRAIRHMTVERGNLRIGERTSGQLLGQLTASGTKLVAVKGIDLSADRPSERSFSRAMAQDALRPTHGAISEVCRRVLGGLPGDRQDDARILLSGGAATPALAEFLKSSLDREVLRPDCPRRLSALGHLESGNASL